MTLALFVLSFVRCPEAYLLVQKQFKSLWDVMS